MALVHRSRDGIGGADDDQALSSFVMALKVAASRSPKVIGELLEAANTAIAAGETQLDGVHLDGLRMSDDDVEEVVSALVSSGIAVRNVSMASNDIGDAGVGLLARLLDDEPGYRCMLASLDIRGNSIGPKGCKVYTLPKLCPTGEDDYWRRSGCYLFAVQLRQNANHCVRHASLHEVLAERLRKNATLTSLDLSSNTLGNDGGFAIAQQRIPPSNRCDEDKEQLCRALKLRATEGSLVAGGLKASLRSCVFSQKTQMLADNFTIERLVVSNTDMSEGGFTAVAAVLREGNNTVRELSIGGQLLRSREEVVACHVSRMLETPPCMLRSLDLSSSRIGDEGAYLLRGALAGHPTMRCLDLSRNRIGITGGQALANLLVEHSTITSLALRANSIGDEGARAFQVVLFHSQTLTMLDLRSNNIHDSGLNALAEGMEYNSYVERLFVWGNHFGQASLRRFQDLEGGRFALVGVFIDVQPFVVDGVFHAAEKLA